MDTAQNPPRGDYQKAENYISKLVTLIEQNKLEVVHTDLQKFDPGSIQDHYRLDLSDYQIEISHSKLPNSGADSYVMLFTNLKNVAEGSAEKTILAYTQLSNTKFDTFKTSADAQIEERKRLEEEKRFKDALSPIDSLLEEATQKASPVQEQSSKPLQTHSSYLADEPHSSPERSPEPASEEPSFKPPYEETDFMPKNNSAGENSQPEKSLPKPDSNPYF